MRDERSRVALAGGSASDVRVILLLDQFCMNERGRIAETT
jgi:hypothetical protein